MSQTDSRTTLDPEERAEWIDALQDVIRIHGLDETRGLIETLVAEVRRAGLNSPWAVHTPYLNTIPPDAQPPYPGDRDLEKRIESYLRWNAMAMVVRANREHSGIGGHIASYASALLLYEIGFNHFWHGPEAPDGPDYIYIQGHSAPGIYARAFLEGRLDEERLGHFRCEVEQKGLPSYPHPWLARDFWQFPTVSMGLGPIQAIYQARFLRYLEHRGLTPPSTQKVWCMLGDGEMDEPESMAGISLAVREKLDNLIFVVNCNLQRLDGPVRGNGKIIQELEAIFRGAGWNVIKVIWGAGWDPLLARDPGGLLRKRMEECVDGEYQNFKSKNGAYVREHFFGKYPELRELVADLSDEAIWELRRGGNDAHKIYAAYSQAVRHQGQPTLILAKSVKGFGMGRAGEAQNTSHQQKKMDNEEIRAFRDRFSLPVSDDAIDQLPFLRFTPDSPEECYLRERRQALGGYLPARRKDGDALDCPPLEIFKTQLEGSQDREYSTTMALVRMLTALTRDPTIGLRIVPIVPDEARTFGMEGLFRQLGIYASAGQLYEPQDADQLMVYHEDRKGQILEEGITEAGSMASWIAAATAYSNKGISMIPFYLFYSMFGFQRIGDLAWAAGDIQARGFLIGGTAGRTTLAGEGLQHCDGHSPVLASNIPNCIVYDPTYAYELAVIIHAGLKRMFESQENVFFYLTAMNENYSHPPLPPGTEAGILQGLYPLRTLGKGKNTVQLMGSGTILREVERAGEILSQDFGIRATVWSATSFTELRRNGLAVERWNRLHPESPPRQNYVETALAGHPGPVIAASDYVRLFADQIRPFVCGRFIALGTDGFGRSDTRAQLRHFFEVDAHSIVLAALQALSQDGLLPPQEVSQALKRFKLDPEKAIPWLT
ncbi:pyruvate dehydrogenase subunit E1 [mine drainage metagenome]|uniref:Pyruvate dehydrogenase E1 component n=2 Tax=mine drainage metagenome TaxID=410659 RepID=T1BVK4_9ZZZZ